MRSVGFLIFDQVGLLELTGPYEVFSAAGRKNGAPLYDVYTISENTDVLESESGLSLIPHYDFDNSPFAEVLIIPGGKGIRNELKNERCLNWLQKFAPAAFMVASVGSGVLLLAKAGFLTDLRAVCSPNDLALLEKLDPEVETASDKKFIDNGHLLTATAGTGGLDMAFHMISRMHGQRKSQETGSYLRYETFEEKSDSNISNY